MSHCLGKWKSNAQINETGSDHSQATFLDHIYDKIWSPPNNKSTIRGMNKLALFLATLIVLSSCQSCEVSESLRTDCGYMGINQQLCEAKDCCWKPANSFEQSPNGIPWCFFKSGSNPCENITFSWNGGPGFDQAFYDKMYALFDANIDIQGKGGIVAAPDPSTPGGSYYYHWMRDAALTMRTYMELNNFELSKVEKKMKSYVGWVKRVQAQTDPQGFDVRINPKFELPNGEVFVGGWCRPQTDGPGLRSGALLLFADLLLKNSQESYVNSDVIPRVKNDLEWVFTNWQSNGCDLWEEVRSSDFFWNRMSYIYTFKQCEAVFTKLGDSSFASRCSSTRSAVEASLSGHWTGTFMTESDNRQRDTSVIHAFSSFEAFSMTDDKVTKTIKELAQTFCSEYSINQQGIKAGIPGILMGRYPGDSYAGGNPWQLLTAVLAKIFYQGANVLMQSNGFEEEEDRKAWFDLLKLPETASLEDQIQAGINAGDSVMYRMWQYVKGDGGHIAEQIDRNNGLQKSAKDLTWSYANILSAMQQQKKATANFAAFKSVTSQ